MLKIMGVVLAALLAVTAVPSSVQAAEVEPHRPNVVFVTADDMRADDLAYMPHTQALLGQLNLTEFISNHPLCCPARAQLLTGQFGHNSGVLHNGGPYGAYGALKERDNTVGTWLKDGGYQTGYVGKFLNGWSPDRWGRPGGWTRFNAWTGSTYSPTQYTEWNDGEPRKPGIYTNDAVTRSSIEQIEEFSGPEPFFVYSSYVAPHGMRDDATGKWIKNGPPPADRHKRMFAGLIPPHETKPSFTLTGEKKREARREWRNRLRSIQSIDEGVRDMVQALDRTGELADTVVIFTSDNGFMLGEHGAKGKNLAWEESLRVPLLARGPGVGTGESSKGSMITDIAPSIAALAGVTPGRVVDGRSDLFASDGGWIDVLIQAGSHNFSQHFEWRGTRTPKWTYVHWVSGRKELYNRVTDPHQMRNLAGRRPAIERRLARQTPDPY